MDHLDFYWSIDRDGKQVLKGKLGKNYKSYFSFLRSNINNQDIFMNKIHSLLNDLGFINKENKQKPEDENENNNDETQDNNQNDQMINTVNRSN